MKERIKQSIIRAFKFFITLEVIFIIIKVIILAYLWNADVPLETLFIVGFGIGGAMWLIIQIKRRIEHRRRLKSLPEPINN